MSKQAHLADVGYQISRLSKALRGAIARESSDMGLTPQQNAVLLNLAPGEHATISEIAERIGVDRPTMTGVIERLVRDGRLETEPNPADGRSRLVSLTEQGRELRPQLAEASARVSARALDGFTDKEVRKLLKLVGRASANLEEDTERA